MCKVEMLQSMKSATKQSRVYTLEQLGRCSIRSTFLCFSATVVHQHCKCTLTLLRWQEWSYCAESLLRFRQGRGILNRIHGIMQHYSVRHLSPPPISIMLFTLCMCQRLAAFAVGKEFFLFATNECTVKLRLTPL